MMVDYDQLPTVGIPRVFPRKYSGDPPPLKKMDKTPSGPFEIVLSDFERGAPCIGERTILFVVKIQKFCFVYNYGIFR